MLCWCLFTHELGRFPDQASMTRIFFHTLLSTITVWISHVLSSAVFLFTLPTICFKIFGAHRTVFLIPSPYACRGHREPTLFFVNCKWKCKILPVLFYSWIYCCAKWNGSCFTLQKLCSSRRFNRWDFISYLISICRLQIGAWVPYAVGELFCGS